MQSITECYNDDELELSSSSYSQADMTPVGVYQPFDNPYLEAAFQALRDNGHWVLEEPSIDGSMAEALAQPNAPSNNRSDSYATDGIGQYHPLDQISQTGRRVPTAPPSQAQNLTVPTLDYANAPPVRYPDQSGCCSAWEPHSSQNIIHHSHIGLEPLNYNRSESFVTQTAQELGNSPGSNYNNQLLQHRSHGYRDKEEWTPSSVVDNSPPFQLNDTPPPPVAIPPPAQLANHTQRVTLPCTAIRLANALSLDNSIRSPGPVHPAHSSHSVLSISQSPMLLHPGTSVENTPVPTIRNSSDSSASSSSSSSSSSGHPSTSQPPPPPPASQPANPPRRRTPRKKHAPITTRTLELMEKYFPEPNFFCQLCISHRNRLTCYTKPERKMEHLASKHVIMVVKGIDKYKTLRRKKINKDRPMLINSEERFAYAKELVGELHCKHCDKDMSAVVRDETIERHLLRHHELSPDRRTRETNRLKELVKETEQGYYNLSDKILCNLPPEAAN